MAIAAGQRTTSWSPGALWLAGLSGLCGAVGLVTFYLALQRGSASVVVPMIGLYPAIVAVLAFLGERLCWLPSPAQTSTAPARKLRSAVRTVSPASTAVAVARGPAIIRAGSNA